MTPTLAELIERYPGSIRHLAKMSGCSHGTLCAIKSKKTKRVGEPLAIAIREHVAAATTSPTASAAEQLAAEGAES